MASIFPELIESRKAWIEQVLRPWCLKASRADLRKAELEWADIAGRADAKGTLWTWAWSRFPALVHEGLSGVDETHVVRVNLRNGQAITGYPDNRRTEAGRLVLLLADGTGDSDPVSIDDIASADRVP